VDGVKAANPAAERRRWRRRVGAGRGVGGEAEEESGQFSRGSKKNPGRKAEGQRAAANLVCRGAEAAVKPRDIRLAFADLARTGARHFPFVRKILAL
jgi:hypothetical protein